MLELDVPGFGSIRLYHIVSDFTGTLSVDSMLMPEVRDRLTKISGVLNVHILIADTFGKARKELEGINCEIRILGQLGTHP